MGNLFSDVTCKPDMAAAALQRDDQSALAARLTPVQWLICGIACLGFAFDLYETLMTALIVRPVLSTLGNLRSGTPEFNLWVGLFFFLPGVAGGIFGIPLGEGVIGVRGIRAHVGDFYSDRSSVGCGGVPGALL